MHNLLETIKETKMPENIMFHLFDSLVASVLSYGCEICFFFFFFFFFFFLLLLLFFFFCFLLLFFFFFFSNAQCIERVHRKFCKRILNVKLSTNNYALYTELGKYPLFIERQLRIIKYWFTLSRAANSNCILKSVYDQMRNRTENGNNAVWTAKVKRLLQRNGLAEVWQYPDLVDVKMFLPVLKTRIIDSFITESREGIINSSSLSLFKELSIIYETTPYLRL